jgi:hypothetical protein
LLSNIDGFELLPQRSGQSLSYLLSVIPHHHNSLLIHHDNVENHQHLQNLIEPLYPALAIMFLAAFVVDLSGVDCQKVFPRDQEWKLCLEFGGGGWMEKAFFVLLVVVIDYVQ